MGGEEGRKENEEEEGHNFIISSALQKHAIIIVSIPFISFSVW
jgi:hypothetical protein